MVFQTAAYALGKRVASFVLGGLVLWQVAEHAGPSKGTAVIHVAIPNADLKVDDDSYRVADPRQSPLVCELKPGPHSIRLLRDGQVLYREEFDVAAGKDIVLVAWDEHDSAPANPPARSASSQPKHSPRTTTRRSRIPIRADRVLPPIPGIGITRR
jgi:hypothetical protein